MTTKRGQQVYQAPWRRAVVVAMWITITAIQNGFQPQRVGMSR